MGKAGSITQFILKQLFRSADLNSLTAELGADPLIGHNESTGVRQDFDVGDPLSGSIGHVTKHIYQRFGYKIKTLDASGVVVHTADLTSISSIDIPIGGVIWWHKSLGGVPALPSGWVECNGQTLSDPESLLDGQVIPDINGQNYFMRGSATSGVTQVSQNLSHNHSATIAGNGGNIGVLTQPQYNMYIAGGGVGCFYYTDPGNWSAVGITSGYTPHYIPSNNIAATLNPTVNMSSAGSPDESRPVNISMVAIMRVK